MNFTFIQINWVVGENITYDYNVPAAQISKYIMILTGGPSGPGGPGSPGRPSAP